MASRKQKAAARRNIKKAQAALRRKRGGKGKSRKRGKRRKGHRRHFRGCSPKILKLARHARKRTKLARAILRACGC